MRHLIFAAVTAATLIPMTQHVTAQGVAFPTLTFPEQGTFCGPLKLCTPLVTQDARD